MRLTQEEKDLIKDYWKTDLDIEIERSRYIVILESNVRYEHHLDGSYDRVNGDRRGVATIKSTAGPAEPVTNVLNPHSDKESIGSPEEMINFLDEAGSLAPDKVVKEAVVR